jgi:ATP-binding cassette subfamily C protein
VLVALALANQWATARPLQVAAQAAFAAESTGAQVRQEAETIQSLGMREAAFARWQQARGDGAGASIAAQDAGGGVSAAIKGVRLFLQSAMLGLGAYLVLQGSATAGVMIASSILLGPRAPAGRDAGGPVGAGPARPRGLAQPRGPPGRGAREQRRTALPRPKGRWS